MKSDLLGTLMLDDTGLLEGEEKRRGGEGCPVFSMVMMSLDSRPEYSPLRERFPRRVLVSMTASDRTVAVSLR